MSETHKETAADLKVEGASTRRLNWIAHENRLKDIKTNQEAEDFLRDVKMDAVLDEMARKQNLGSNDPDWAKFTGEFSGEVKLQDGSGQTLHVVMTNTLHKSVAYGDSMNSKMVLRKDGKLYASWQGTNGMSLPFRQMRHCEISAAKT